MSSKTGQRQRRKEARPAELLEAALDVFVEKGFSAARLDEIAARAGVSKGTLYLYYDNKESLFKAVIETSMLPRIAEGEAAFAALRDDPAKLLEELVLGWWDLIGNTKVGGIPKLVFAEARNFPDVAQFYFDNVIVRGRDLFGAVIKRGIELKVFRDIDTTHVCQLVLSPLLVASLWRQSFECCEAHSIDYGRYLRTHLNILMHGLLATPPKPPVKKKAKP